MPAQQHFFIQPYRRGRKGLVPAERRPAQTEAGAIRTAENMASRFAGLVAFACEIDTETGDTINPREIARHGEAPVLVPDWV
ncbi:MAG: hypothetical protein DI629_03655 [Mesorhizobium amorphae]|nr:MAG: hypothetical protein DI629_03655 [Mesorhizobium amorphae]